MRLSALVTVALAAVAVASPLQRRAKAQVITKCTVPNTAALTFVSRVLFRAGHDLNIAGNIG